MMTAAITTIGPLLGAGWRTDRLRGTSYNHDGGLPPSGGDSGAPVFLRGDDDEVDLAGVLFARTGNLFHFGKTGLVYWELGSSQTWNSCTSGC